jgi:homoserine O-acetyltransferase
MEVHPLSINPETGEPYFHTFPTITIRDIVNSFDLLREHLGISKSKLVLVDLWVVSRL